MTYLVVLWLHLLGAALLFGTGLGIAFFAWCGYRQGLREGSIGLIRGVLRLTVVADTVFTATAAVVQPITGYLLWRMTGGQWPDPWLAWVLALYVFVGACWLPVFWLQLRMRDMAVQAAQGDGALPPLYARYARRWEALGYPAFVAMAVVFYLMVNKPALAF